MSSCLWACVYMGFRTDLRSLRSLRLQRLGASWGHLGSILGHLGASWEQLASILGAFEESMLAYVGVCWPILRNLEHIRAAFWKILILYCFLQCFWAPTLAKMAQVGSKLAPSWPMLGQVGDILELCRPMLAHLGVQKHCKKQCFLKIFYFGQILRILGTSWTILKLCFNMYVACFANVKKTL